MADLPHYQNRRIAMFDEIISELANMKPMLLKAKNATIDYYSTNPESPDVVFPTELILELLGDIRSYLKLDSQQ